MSFNPALHPRGTGGMFVETFHSEPGFSLGTPGASINAEWINEISDDIATVTATVHLRGKTEAEVDEIMDARDAARDRLAIYGDSMDWAAIAVGEVVAARAEEIAGITADEAQAAWADRSAAAIRGYEEAAEMLTEMTGYDAVTMNVMLAARNRLNLTRDGRDPETLADKRRLADGYLAALAEVRPMGGDLKLHSSSAPKAARLFQEAAQVYPTDWIEASNTSGHLQAENTRKRGEYTHERAVAAFEPAPRMVSRGLLPEEFERSVAEPSRDWVPTGKKRPVHKFDRATGRYRIEEKDEYESVDYAVKEPGRFKPTKTGAPFGKGWEPWVQPGTGQIYWRRPNMSKTVVGTERVASISTGARKSRYMADQDPDMATSIHELSHRAESTVQGIRELEHKFLYRRTLVPSSDGGMQQQPLEPIHSGTKKEVCRPDHFPNRYMGREYEHADTEILSMGAESLFSGTNGALIGVGRSDSDREYRAFVLGVMATAKGMKTY